MLLIVVSQIFLVLFDGVDDRLLVLLCTSITITWNGTDIICFYFPCIKQILVLIVFV